MEQDPMNEQLLNIFAILKHKGATLESVQRTIASGVLSDVFDPMAKFDNHDAFRTALKLDTLATDVFHIIVDYEQSLEEMIAAGDYNWKNDDIIAKYFPIMGEGIVKFEACYFHHVRGFTYEKAVTMIGQTDEDNPWFPAKIEHILSLGKTYLEELLKFPIIGLGSVAKDSVGCRVPCLDWLGSERRLLLRSWRDDWLPLYCFLAVRKISSS